MWQVRPAIISGRSAQNASAEGDSFDTWNPADKGANITLSNGNRTATATVGAAENTRSIMGHSTGKYHFEFTVDNVGTSFDDIGIASTTTAWPTGGDAKYAVWRLDSQRWFYNSTNGDMGGAAWTCSDGDVCAIEVDFDAQIIRAQNFTKSSGWSTDLSLAFLTGGPWYISYSGLGTTDAVTLNTGQAAYSVTPTSGFGNW